MKVSRCKKAGKRINFYINNFKYHAPIQILVDGTFCFHALKNQLVIEDQLKNLFQLELRFLTTPCIIIESEKLGSKLFNTVKKLKAVQLNRCGHEKNPLSGANCIKSIVKQNHYVVATQDRDLQDWIRSKIGIALLYLHQKVPVIDEPSEATRKFVERKSLNFTPQSELNKLTTLKKKEGIIKEPTNHVFKKKRKASGPNPLSCKKKKNSADDNLRKVKNPKIQKRKKPNKFNVEKS